MNNKHPIHKNFIAEKIMNDTGRTCSKCGRFKTWDNFYANKLGKYGRMPTCKDCLNSFWKYHNYDNIDIEIEIRIVVNDTGRTCTKCGNFFTWDFFTRKKNGLFGYRSTCKVCSQEQQKNYRLKCLE